MTASQAAPEAMTASQAAPDAMTASQAAPDVVTCARCQMTTRWMAGHEHAGPPAAWVTVDGDLYCLTCQRALAAEAGSSTAPEDSTTASRAKMRAVALVEFEIKRDPERSNGQIARAIHTSVPAVIKARQRLEAAAGG
jgi:hypothetical protein